MGRAAARRSAVLQHIVPSCSMLAAARFVPCAPSRPPVAGCASPVVCGTSHVAWSTLSVASHFLHVICCTPGVLLAAYVAFVSCKSRHVARWCTLHVTCCKPSVARCMLHVSCCMTDVARCKSSAACCRRWRSSHWVSREARKRTRRRSTPTHLGSSRWGAYGDSRRKC